MKRVVQMRANIAFSTAVLLAVLHGAAAGQTNAGPSPRAGQLTREELTQLLERLEESASSSGNSDRLRERAVRESQIVRERLQHGDFQVGDRIVLFVEGEPQLSDTLVVTPGRTIRLAQIGDISLNGVLRSELQSHLEAELARFLRDPRVRSEALIRLAVLGAVRTPGFYTLAASMLLEEALMAAGGPDGAADMDRMSVRRGELVLLDGELLQQAITDGRTLDQLSLQAGDRLEVPAERPGLFEGGVIRTLLVALPPLIYLATQLLRN